MSTRLELLGPQGSQEPYVITFSRNCGTLLKEIVACMTLYKSTTTWTIGILMKMNFVFNESNDLRRYVLALNNKDDNSIEFIKESFIKIGNCLFPDLIKLVSIETNVKLNKEFSKSKEV